MPSASTLESAATAASVLVCARTRRAARALVRLLPATWLVRATSRRRKHNHTSSSSVIEASFKSFHSSRFVHPQSISLVQIQIPPSKATTKPTRRPSSHPRPFAITPFPPRRPRANPNDTKHASSETIARSPGITSRASPRAQIRQPRETCDRSTRSVGGASRLRVIHPTVESPSATADDRKRDEKTKKAHFTYP